MSRGELIFPKFHHSCVDAGLQLDFFTFTAIQTAISSLGLILKIQEKVLSIMRTLKRVLQSFRKKHFVVCLSHPNKEEASYQGDMTKNQIYTVLHGF